MIEQQRFDPVLSRPLSGAEQRCLAVAETQALHTAQPEAPPGVRTQPTRRGPTEKSSFTPHALAAVEEVVEAKYAQLAAAPPLSSLPPACSPRKAEPVVSNHSVASAHEYRC